MTELTYAIRHASSYSTMISSTRSVPVLDTLQLITTQFSEMASSEMYSQFKSKVHRSPFINVIVCIFRAIIRVIFGRFTRIIRLRLCRNADKCRCELNRNYLLSCSYPITLSLNVLNLDVVVLHNYGRLCLVGRVGSQKRPGFSGRYIIEPMNPRIYLTPRRVQILYSQFLQTVTKIQGNQYEQAWAEMLILPYHS